MVIKEEQRIASAQSQMFRYNNDVPLRADHCGLSQPRERGCFLRPLYVHGVWKSFIAYCLEVMVSVDMGDEHDVLTEIFHHCSIAR